MDLLLLGYLGFASIVALARHETTGRGWLLLSNGLTLLLVLLLARNEHGRFGRALREIYPILLLTSLYGGSRPSERGRYSAGARRPGAALGGDAVRRAAQPRLVACSAEPALVAHPPRSVLPPTTPLCCCPRCCCSLANSLGALRRLMLALMATFVFCCLWFVLFPVAGPYYEFPRPSGAFVDNPAARLVYRTLAAGSS